MYTNSMSNYYATPGYQNTHYHQQQQHPQQSRMNYGHQQQHYAQFSNKHFTPPTSPQQHYAPAPSYNTNTYSSPSPPSPPQTQQQFFQHTFQQQKYRQNQQQQQQQHFYNTPHPASSSQPNNARPNNAIIMSNITHRQNCPPTSYSPYTTAPDSQQQYDFGEYTPPASPSPNSSYSCAGSSEHHSHRSITTISNNSNSSSSNDADSISDTASVSSDSDHSHSSAISSVHSATYDAALSSSYDASLAIHVFAGQASEFDGYNRSKRPSGQVAQTKGGQVIELFRGTHTGALRDACGDELDLLNPYADC